MKTCNIPANLLTFEQILWVEKRESAKREQEEYVNTKRAWLIRWIWIFAFFMLVTLGTAVFLESIEMLKVLIAFLILYLVVAFTYVLSLNPLLSKFKREFPDLTPFLVNETGVELNIY